MPTQTLAQTTTLQGQILYHGLIPPIKTEIVEHDQETCGTTSQTIPISVNPEGGLHQVVVSIEGLQDSANFPKHDPLIITNDRCHFRPHIGVGSVKQFLEVRNVDAILHNTHIRTETRAFFNVVLLPQANGIKKIMKQPGLMTISCNKHPFMRGYIQVFDHPYHAITDSQGAFSIPNLPPGTHRLTLWHKTLGTVHQTITLAQNTDEFLSIEFPVP